MTRGPLVSIIIPVFNGANFIRFAIESALSQTYPNIEIIVVNDGSTDDGLTKETVRPYFSRVQYFEKPNGGVSSALNLGIQKAKGQYISWLSHDDYFSNDKIRLQVLKISKYKDSKYVPYCKSVFVNEDGKILKKFNFFVINSKRTCEGLNHFFTFNICFASCLLPRDYLLSHPFDEESRFIQDSEMFYQFIKAGFVFVYTKKAFYFSRNHPQRITVTRLDLFAKDSQKMHLIYLNDIRNTNNVLFAKKYLAFLSSKAPKYHFFGSMRGDVIAFLKEKKAWSLWTKGKASFIFRLFSVLFFVRKVFSGR